MKNLKGLDFVKRTSSVGEVKSLIAELKASLGAFKDPSAGACDKILRACNQRVAEGKILPAHLESLMDLADLAYRGYVASGNPLAPLYAEKILFHLFKNVVGQSATESCCRFAEHLYNSLVNYKPSDITGERFKDYEAIAKSCFSVYWKWVDVNLNPRKPDFSECQNVLSHRLRAVGFLALLEGFGPLSLPPEPSTYISITSRHAAVVCTAYESQREPLTREDALFIWEQVSRFLIQPIAEREDWPDSSNLQRLLCLFELSFQNYKRLCRVGCLKEGAEAVSRAQGFVKGAGYPDPVLNSALEMCHITLRLQQDLSGGTQNGRALFADAACNLRSLPEGGDVEHKAGIESCQFFVCQLDACMKRNENEGREWRLEEVLSLFSFLEEYTQLLQKQMDSMLLSHPRHFRTLKQYHYRSLQLYSNIVSDFLSSQKMLTEESELVRTCKRAAQMMLDLLQGLSEQDQSDYLSNVAFCLYNLAYGFYSHKLYSEALSIVHLLCERLWTDLTFPKERLHKCFRLLVECCRKAADFELGLDSVVLWLMALRDNLPELMVEPVSCWVRIKIDAVKNGEEDLRLRTLKDGLEDHDLDPQVLLLVLEEELKAYKASRADTAQERYNVICDLLDLRGEGSGADQERAAYLIELAQVLCYHDFPEQTDCSAVDSVEEALRLLSALPGDAEKLLDDKAHASLWLYISTLESTVKKSIEREERVANLGADLGNLEEQETNDLNYEDQLQDDKFVHDGINFNLAADSGQSQYLEDALVLWKKLVPEKRLPQVRSTDQTMASLHIMASLYRLIGKPLQAIESYFLIVRLVKALSDDLPLVNALCQITKLLLTLGCPSAAQGYLDEAELWLQSADALSDGYSLMKLTCAVLRSQLYCSSQKVEEGLQLLLQVHQDPTLHKSSKACYLLKASVLQLVATYLNLPFSAFPLQLRRRLYSLGWKMQEAALLDAHKLLCSIVILLTGKSIVPSHKANANIRFMDQGENLLQKWQVLADLLSCCRKLVHLFGWVGSVCEAKAFCLEALKLTMKFKLLTQCADFLVSKAELELQRSRSDLCHLDLQQVLFLIESCTDFDSRGQVQGKMKIKVKKQKAVRKQTTKTDPTAEGEDAFIKGPSLRNIATVSRDKEGALTASPVLKSKVRKQLSFLSHQPACWCLVCTDVELSLACTKWTVVFGEAEAAAGNHAECRRLFQTSLERCETLAERFAGFIQGTLAKEKPAKSASLKGKGMPSFGFLDDLCAKIYSKMAAFSLTPKPEKTTWKVLNAGLIFLTSKAVCLPSLEHAKAALLLAKAVALISSLAAKHCCSATELFSPLWAWKPFPIPDPAKEKAAVLPRKKDPKTSAKKAGPTPARKAKTPSAKTAMLKVPLPDSRDVFSVFGLDMEAPSVIIERVTALVPRTPTQRGRPAVKASSCSTAKASRKAKGRIQVYDESFTPKLKRGAIRAPKATKKIQSRLKVMYSDDSDMEMPATESQAAGEEEGGLGDQLEFPNRPWQGQATYGKACSSFKTTRAKDQGSLPVMESLGATVETVQESAASASKAHVKTTESSTSMDGSFEIGGVTQSSKRTAARPAAKSTTLLGEKKVEKKLGKPRRKMKGQSEEEVLEAMRTINEEEDAWETSIEVLRGSDTEEERDSKQNAELRSTAKAGVEAECEVLRRDVGLENWDRALGGSCSRVENPDLFSMQSLLSALTSDVDFSALDSVYACLCSAFHSISHCPPSILFSHLCQLLALCRGSCDPYTTAYFVSESVAITARHQMLTNIHKKLSKLTKESVSEVAEKLQGLTLRDGGEDKRQQHLSDLGRLFEFSSAGPEQFPQQEIEDFKQQLKEIPDGMTVCVLSLVSVHPGAVGDTLLVSRLEKGCTPVTVQIPTAQSEMPLSSLLCKFDSFLEEQKTINYETDKKIWWEGRADLDKRMKLLMDSMEVYCLSCWKGMLLPSSKDPEVEEEALALQNRLAQCGLQDPSRELLKVILNGSHLLTSKHVKMLSYGLCQKRPEEASALLQAAVDKLRNRTGQSNGPLVLVLDKHLQKLPWENIPLLRSRPVTRLPSLRFLLSYSIIQKTGSRSVLTDGVDPSNTFFLLNPQSNLPETEKRLKDFFQSEKGWIGVIGKAPTPDQVQLALTSQDLYVYCGHGAGVHFLDGLSIQKLDCRAVSLLFGCSSAALAVRGDLEGAGIVLKYIMAGCPLVLGNLWDVTDRDIDRYTEALLRSWLKAGSKAPLLDYVSQAREAPKFKYLIGAAPVVYGLPVLLQ
ncbi:separin isoform X2 [Latimeria chalumnae]|uniref:separin isoform X2 n=1 Tax=Latimeria chalumnae TaxID=7897 RepID=UPI00313CF4B0